MREQMEQNWYLDVAKSQIGRKRIPFLSRFASWLGFRRTNMIDLYSMTKRAYHSPSKIENMMAFSFPLEHDNFPKPDAYPFYYRMMNNWTIEKGCADFIKNGPLFSENSRNVIVHSRVFVKSLPQQLWKFIAAFGVLFGITTSFLRLFGVV